MLSLGSSVLVEVVCFSHVARTWQWSSQNWQGHQHWWFCVRSAWPSGNQPVWHHGAQPPKKKNNAYSSVSYSHNAQRAKIELFYSQKLGIKWNIICQVCDVILLDKYDDVFQPVFDAVVTWMLWSLPLCLCSLKKKHSLLVNTLPHVQMAWVWCHPQTLAILTEVSRCFPCSFHANVGNTPVCQRCPCRFLHVCHLQSCLIMCNLGNWAMNCEGHS